MNTLIILALIALVLYYNYERFFGKLYHKNFPDALECDRDTINMGVIPDRLSWVIPSDYELREDTSMCSRIEPIFVDGVKTPLWALIITLHDCGIKSETTVLYDLNGELYKY